MIPPAASSTTVTAPADPPLLNLLLQSAGARDSEVVVEDLRSGRRQRYRSLRALAQAWLDDPPVAAGGRSRPPDPSP